MGHINLSLDKIPEIQAADYCHFKTGILHPDRIINAHDIVYVAEGEWEIWEENSSFLLYPGDIVFLFAGRRHFGKVPCAAGTKTRYIHFYTGKEDAFSEKERGGDAGAISISSLTKCGRDENIVRLFEEVIHLHWSSIIENRMMARIKLSELLVSMSRLAGHKEIKRTGSIDYVISLIEQYPEKNYEINELADKIEVSRRYLTAGFKDKTGVSIKQFQLNMKIKRAASILQNSPFVSIKEVAEQFSFYDEFHFSKQFKQKIGCYPSDYRKH